MSHTWTDLLAAVGVAPALPGARCRGKHHLFDDAEKNEAAEVVAQRHAQALQLCSGCTALARAPPGSNPCRRRVARPVSWPASSRPPSHPADHARIQRDQQTGQPSQQTRADPRGVGWHRERREVDP